MSRIHQFGRVRGETEREEDTKLKVAGELLDVQFPRYILACESNDSNTAHVLFPGKDIPLRNACALVYCTIASIADRYDAPEEKILEVLSGLSKVFGGKHDRA